MNVYKDVQEKEFKLDPKAIKMGTKWVVTNKDTHKHTKPTINVRFVGREFADDARKGGAVCRNARASSVAVLGLQTYSRRCASRSPCRRDEFETARSDMGGFYDQHSLEYQDEVKELVVQADGDWTCRTTRSSNSRGWVSRGGHFLFHWSSVQARVAFCTAEAQHHSQDHGFQEMPSQKYLLGELRTVESRSHKCILGVDSTARKGIILRRGVGQLEHLATRKNWGQPVVQRESIDVRCTLCRMVQFDERCL